MKISGVDIRPGYILDFEGGLWRVLKTQHTQPGKGGAYMQVEMKEIRNGTKRNERFRSADTVEKARLDQTPYQYLYSEGDNLVLMDNNTYEQITVSGELAGDAVIFLQDGMEVEIESYEGAPIGISLPESVVLTIKETEPIVKGQTAANSFKPAIMENGVRLMVPPFIAEGEKIIVNTASCEYMERAK
ncbi:MAG: elongation factor P [Alphaproteobacteria bacterium CG11_big_fil_rev_8_21_14_0_20_44_7]|nr:MAG: elongation factor P [Alphaproteobacteria bacterium CG11_big_fil_rev_8_21_14_0_20_44_7]